MPATLDVTCPNCGKALKVPAELEGRRVKCKGCDEAFVVKAPKATKAAKPKAAPPPPPPPAAPTYKRPFDEDEDDNPNPITVIKEEDVARCPHCAVELDPPDATVCTNCGFNNKTRVKAESKKVVAASGGDWASHLAPGIIALLLAIAIIVTDIICLVNMEEWLTGSELQSDAVDPVTGKKTFAVKPGAFTALIWAFSIVLLIPALKFAWNRLVRDYRPEEKVKK